MKCLVTGGAGFAGASLVERLAGAGRAVTILIRESSARALPPGVQAIVGDITDQGRMREVVAQVKPDEIYHLAALTFVPDSFKDGDGFLRTNLMGVVYLLAAARQEAPQARVLVVSSAGVYGAAGGAADPIGEETCLRPVDPYGASKAAAEIWARQEAGRGHQAIVCVRPFGHIGPRQSPRFVAADFARQVRRIKLGEQEPRIEVGNLDAVREFTDVEDMAGGYMAAMENGRSGAVYNLCSGKGMSVRDLLKALLECAGVDAQVVTASERLRPVDIPSLVGSPDLAREELKWQPSLPWHDTLAKMLAGPEQDPN